MNNLLGVLDILCVCGGVCIFLYMMYVCMRGVDGWWLSAGICLFWVGVVWFQLPSFFLSLIMAISKVPPSFPPFSFFSRIHSSWNQGPEAEHEHQLAGEAG